MITGSRDLIGTALNSGLPYDITDNDLPKNDVLNYPELKNALKGYAALIHLVWNFKSDGWLADNLNSNNILMSHYVYQTAYRT